MGIVSKPAHYTPTIQAAAKEISCPVFFIMQLEDELFNREECLALFDAFSSSDKRLHANSGLHPFVPIDELDFSADFLADTLKGIRPQRENMTLLVSS
jgi:esterase/lipase